MKKAIVIGGGPLGLSTAVNLTKKGFQVHLFERSNELGGLAGSFDFQGILTEYYYHFFYFKDSKVVEDFISSLGITPEVKWQNIESDTFSDGRFIDFNSFAALRSLAKGRFAQVIFQLLKLKIFLPNKDLDSVSAVTWAKRVFGKSLSEQIWIPLLVGKFGAYSDQISALWLASRIRRHMSTQVLPSGLCRFGYLLSTYNPVIDKVKKIIECSGGTVTLSCALEEVFADGNRLNGLRFPNRILSVDASTPVFSTIPLMSLNEIPGVSRVAPYLGQCKGVGVIVMILRIKSKLSAAYWTTVVDEQVPFNAVIQQNRLYEKSSDEIVYLSKYCIPNTSEFAQDDEGVFEAWWVGLQKMFPKISRQDLVDWRVVRTRSAAPVPFVNFGESLPGFKSTLQNFFHAGYEQIFPEDRGVGNSIALGKKMVDIFIGSTKSTDCFR